MNCPGRSKRDLESDFLTGYVFLPKVAPHPEHT